MPLVLDAREFCKGLILNLRVPGLTTLLVTASGLTALALMVGRCWCSGLVTLGLLISELNGVLVVDFWEESGVALLLPTVDILLRLGTGINDGGPSIGFSVELVPIVILPFLLAMGALGVGDALLSSKFDWNINSGLLELNGL